MAVAKEQFAPLLMALKDGDYGLCASRLSTQHFGPKPL